MNPSTMHPSRVGAIRKIAVIFLGLVLFLLALSFWGRRGEKQIPVALSPLPPHIRQSIQDLEYTEMKGNRIVLRIRSRQYQQTADGQQLLEGIQAVYYREEDQRQDAIQSESVVYNPDLQTTTFRGRVRIHTQEGTDISTSSLVYYKQEETARSSEEFQFRHTHFSGKGRGFVYEFKKGLLHIVADADFTVQNRSKISPDRIDNSIRIRSSQAVISRNDRLNFIGRAEIRQDPYTLAAEEILLSMDAGREYVDEMIGTGGACLELADKRGVQRLQAVRVELRFIQDSNQLDAIVATDQAVLDVSSKESGILRVHSSQIELGLTENGVARLLRTAEDVEMGRTLKKEWVWLQGGSLVLRFFPDRAEPMEMNFGLPTKVRYIGDGQFMEYWAEKSEIRFQDQPGRMAFAKVEGKGSVVWKRAPYPLSSPFQDAFDLRKINPVAWDTVSTREMVVDFYPHGKTPSQVYASGGCQMDSRHRQGEQEVNRQVFSDWIRVHFPEDGPHADRLEAGPWVRMEEPLPQGKRTVRCSMLQAVFNPKDGQVREIAVQDNFRLEQKDLVVSSRSATYQSTGEKWRLEGDPQVWDQQGITSAEEVEILQKGDLIRGCGRVRSIFLQKTTASKTLSPSVLSRDQSPILVTAGFMESDRLGKTVKYVQKAKVSQGVDSIRAEEIVWYQQTGDLQAVGSVMTSFRRSSEAGKADRLVVVFGTRLDYSQKEQALEYRDEVLLRSDEVQIRAPHLRVISDDKRASLSKVAAWGGVQMSKGLMQGAGEECNYDSALQQVQLIGKPAIVWEPGRGRSIGSRLTLTIPGDKILVES